MKESRVSKGFLISILSLNFTFTLVIDKKKKWEKRKKLIFGYNYHVAFLISFLPAYKAARHHTRKKEKSLIFASFQSSVLTSSFPYLDFLDSTSITSSRHFKSFFSWLMQHGIM